MRTQSTVIGFTLIELLVVLAMIASVTALVGPSLFKQLDNIKAQSESRQVVNLIDKLGQKAFLSNAIIEITFEGGTVKYGYRNDPKSVTSRKFSIIDCGRQTLTVNQLGFLKQTTLNCAANGREMTLNLGKVNEL